MISSEELLGLAPDGESLEDKAADLTKLGRRLVELGSLRGVTALKTEEAIKDEFLLDSLQGLCSLPTQVAEASEPLRVIDIGTGGGIPGLVLAIMRPDIEFTLTDSASKKTRWVTECVEELDLRNVTVRTSRLELLGREPDARERFDAVTAKALAPLAVLVELAVPLLKVGGVLVAYKGPAFSDEIREAKKALKLLGASVVRRREYSVGEKSYCIVEVRKGSPTGSRYPRRDGVPQKSPL